MTTLTAKMGSFPVLETLAASIQFSWRDAGRVTLEPSGKISVLALPEIAGLYRFTLTPSPGQTRRRVYIGETDNLRRRLAGYRNPGPSQRTNLRLNGLLVEHLTSAGIVLFAVAVEVAVTLDSDDQWQSVNLARRAGRLLAENAALVLAHVTDDADIENLG